MADSGRGGRRAGQTTFGVWMATARTEATRAVTEQLGADTSRVGIVGSEPRSLDRADELLAAALRHRMPIVHRCGDLADTERLGQRLCLLVAIAECAEPSWCERVARYALAHPLTDVVMVCPAPQGSCLQHAARARVRDVLATAALADRIPAIACVAAERRDWLVRAMIEEEITARAVCTFGVDAALSLGLAPPSPPEPIDLEEVERSEIVDALVATHNNRTAAAERLRISRGKLARRMRDLGICEPTIAEASSRMRAWPYRPDGDGDRD